MDKRHHQDVKRGTNRFSMKQSGLRSGFPGKSKKRGIFKKLDSAGEVNSSHEDHQLEMVCESSSSDREIEASSKKSKFLKRNLKDTGGVDHASVPRKLRSAVKKRNLESKSRPLLVSKKLRRSKTRAENLRKTVTTKEKPEMETKLFPEPITKDEEEVVETLFALAGMLAGIDSAEMINRLDDGGKEAKPERIKDRVVTEAEPIMAGSPEGPGLVRSSDNTKQINDMLLRQTDHCNGSTTTFDFFGRLKQSSINVTEPSEKTSEITLSTETLETKLATSDADCKNNALALWPGLSSTIDPGDRLLAKPLAVKVPSCTGDKASLSETASFRRDPSSVKLDKSKRSASHIYISRLIEGLKNRSSSASVKESEYELPFPMNGSEKVTRAGVSLTSPTERYPDTHLLDKFGNNNEKSIQDMTDLGLGICGSQPPQKQCYDFLSLASASEARSHFPVPDSAPQHYHTNAFSMSQPDTRHIFSAYNNRLPHAIIGHQGYARHLDPFATTYDPSSMVISSQQQQFWAAQYMTATRNSMWPNQNVSFQNERPNQTQTGIRTLQSMPATRYSHPYQHHHQRLMAAASAVSVNHNHHLYNSSSKPINRQEHRFPLVYEESRTSQVQLICNEQS